MVVPTAGVGDIMMVLETVSVTVTAASQVGFGDGTGSEPEQVPSLTKNLEVWA
jgi:hypothetical protein